jgi:hypothetical protein
MIHNRQSFVLLTLLFVFALCSCARNKTVCPPAEGTSADKPPLAEMIDLPPPIPASSEPVEVLIQGRKMKVDKLVDYPLCNDNWSGTIYVSCEAQVAEAELDPDSNPLFLKGCDLNIAPNTTVYVAAHNDAPYYKGCSCHTGLAPEP